MEQFCIEIYLIDILPIVIRHKPSCNEWPAAEVRAGLAGSYGVESVVTIITGSHPGPLYVSHPNGRNIYAVLFIVAIQ